MKWVDHLAAVIAHQNHKYIIDAGLKLYVWNTSIILIVVETHRKHIQDNSFVRLSTIFKKRQIFLAEKWFWSRNSTNPLILFSRAILVPISDSYIAVCIDKVLLVPLCFKHIFHLLPPLLMSSPLHISGTIQVTEQCLNLLSSMQCSCWAITLAPMESEVTVDWKKANMVCVQWVQWQG